MKSTDKTEQLIKQKFDQLGEIDTSTNRREVRNARRKLKHQLHKHERNAGKQQLRRIVEGTFDE